MTTATSTPTTDAKVHNLAAKLQTKLSALGDGRHCKSDDEYATYRRNYDAIQGTISGLMNAPADLARAEARLAEVEDRRATVLQKQAEIEQAIHDAPNWRNFAEGRARDREYERQQVLTRQLQMLRDGTLLMGPGVRSERVADLDARIAELTERRDRAQRAFEGYLKQAKVLLTS